VYAPDGIGDKAVAEPLSGRYAFDIHLSVAGIAKVGFGSNPAVPTRAVRAPPRRVDRRHP